MRHTQWLRGGGGGELRGSRRLSGTGSLSCGGRGGDELRGGLLTAARGSSGGRVAGGQVRYRRGGGRRLVLNERRGRRKWRLDVLQLAGRRRCSRRRVVVQHVRRQLQKTRRMA